jgi:hypothetical protein
MHYSHAIVMIPQHLLEPRASSVLYMAQLPRIISPIMIPTTCTSCNISLPTDSDSSSALTQFAAASNLASVMRIASEAARRFTCADGATFVLREGDISGHAWVD